MRDTVLFISPSTADAATVCRMLGRIAIPCQHVTTLRKARQRIETGTFGVVLTEARLPDGTWPDAVRLAAQAGCSSAVVVTDNQANARFWVDALESGAYDVLVKPFRCGEVQQILTNALRQPPRLIRVMHAA